MNVPVRREAGCRDSAMVMESANLKSRWSIYSRGDLKQRCSDLGSDNYLIEGLVPRQSLGILVGDSGLGKSPLVYQMAVCVASGRPFLGRAVKQGRVLCLDFENGLGQVDEMVTGLTTFLQASPNPEDLLLWNVNDCPSNFGQPGHTALDMVREVKPSLVTVDALTGLFPDIEDRNNNALRALQEIRAAMRDTGASFIGVHHIKKPPDKPEHKPTPLEHSEGNMRAWFLQARGARALINSTDVRIGVDAPALNGEIIKADGQQEEIALVLGGFARVRGESPVTYVARVSDEENGDPLGYRPVKAAILLGNSAQMETFKKLPTTFRFKDARRAYGKGAQATTDFLKKCQGLGILRKVGNKYEKEEGAD